MRYYSSLYCDWTNDFNKCYFCIGRDNEKENQDGTASKSEVKTKDKKKKSSSDCTSDKARKNESLPANEANFEGMYVPNETSTFRFWCIFD